MILNLFFLALIIYLFIIFKRAKRYRYDTSKDYLYDLNKNLITKLTASNNRLILPDNYNDYDSLFLKIELSSTLSSYFFKPSITIQDTKHYFEYGAKGTRYLNISNVDSANINFVFNNINIFNKTVNLYGYKNQIDLSKKILILAPHADDAELAAFGLYKTAKDITIVTTTAGEEGLCNYCDLYKNDITKQALKKAELRALDAITTPLLGNVEYKNSIALGYFGGSLKWMSENKEKMAMSKVDGINNMNLFRRVSHSDIKLKVDAQPTYESFLNDVKEILKQTKPEIIITPHPTIDSHQDHIQTTLSLIKAMKETQINSKLLLYTNHLRLSETYPLGTMYSSVSLPPNHESFYYDSIYSFKLNESLQKDKFFALENMHDLRDSLSAISIKRALKQLNKLIKRKISGKDNNYFKRAVRANELFFVVESNNIDKLI